MDPSHGFGTSTLCGVPSNDLMTNVLYMNQAQLHASNHPYDIHAQRQYQYWQAVVRQQQAAMAAMPTGRANTNTTVANAHDCRRLWQLTKRNAKHKLSK